MRTPSLSKMLQKKQVPLAIDFDSDLEKLQHKMLRIQQGHAHTTIPLTPAEVAAGVPGLYTLLTGSHDHTFQFTAADFIDLQQGGTVVKRDLQGDGHIINVLCGS
jgi:hypothetical protein